MRPEQGLTLDVGYGLDPKPVDADLEKLACETDEGWIGWTFPWHPESQVKAATHVRCFYPVDGQPQPNITDTWFTPSLTIDAFTTETLGCVADMWRRIPENHLPNAEWSNATLVDWARRQAQG